MEQVDQNWIIDPGPISPSKPLSPLDHIHPELIVKEEVWEHIPPPLILNNGLIVGLILMDHPKIGVLGYL